MVLVDERGIVRLYNPGNASYELLAAKIEAEGGGRVALYTADEGSAMPDNVTVAEAWSVDGLLITGQGVFGTITIGPTLQAKLSTVGTALVNDFSTPGPQTTESWMMSTLARVVVVASKWQLTRRRGCGRVPRSLYDYVVN